MTRHEVHKSPTHVMRDTVECEGFGSLQEHCEERGAWLDPEKLEKFTCGRETPNLLCTGQSQCRDTEFQGMVTCVAFEIHEALHSSN